MLPPSIATREKFNGISFFKCEQQCRDYVTRSDIDWDFRSFWLAGNDAVSRDSVIVFGTGGSMALLSACRCRTFHTGSKSIVTSSLGNAKRGGKGPKLSIFNGGILYVWISYGYFGNAFF